MQQKNAQHANIERSNDTTSLEAGNPRYLMQNNDDFIFIEDQYYSINTLYKPILKPEYETTINNSDGDNKIIFSNDESVQKSNFLLVLIIIVLVVIAWLRVSYNKYINQTFKSTFNYQFSYKLFRQNNNVSKRASALMTFVYLNGFSIFILLLLSYYNVSLELSEITTFFIINGIIIAFYLLKYVVYKIIGWIFSYNNTTSEYLFNFFVFNKVAGFLMIPMVIAILYAPEVYASFLITFTIIIFSILYLLSVLRGISICFKYRFSIIYMILYLCTLEILPIAIIYKTIKLYI